MSQGSIYELYFSPTGQTIKVVDFVACMLGDALSMDVAQRNITLPGSRESDISFTKDDVVVVGFPVYAGKLPNKILPFLQQHIHFSGAKVVAIVTFGNRNFDNGLAELVHIIGENRGRVVGAAACVVPHAFSHVLGADRPDDLDKANIERFAASVSKRIENNEVLVEDVIPGDWDAAYYTPLGVDKKPVMFLKAKPKTEASACIDCKKCARLCPMGAIDFNNTHEVPGTCIKCQSCVHVCPTQAKYFDDEAFLSHVAMLEKAYTRSATNWYSE